MVLVTLLLTSCSLALSVMLTPLVRGLAVRNGWVDKPDNVRKIHKAPIPRLGGIPILLACAISFSLLMFATGSSFAAAWKLLPASLMIFFIGLWDDIKGLTPRQKLAGETIAAAVGCLTLARIYGLPGAVAASWAVPLAIIWLVACTNAFNLIDGADGVATGSAILGVLPALVFGILQHDLGLIAASAVLLGALLGFLFFNFYPASIFLGDSGSLFVGFVLGCLGLIWAHKATTIRGMVAPLIAFSIPLIDTSLTIARRFLRGHPIFTADRGHIHHRLLDRGLSPRGTALRLYAAGCLAAILSILVAAPNRIAGILGIELFCISVWAGIRYLGYSEFNIIAQLFRHVLLPMIRFQYALREHEEALRSAATAEDCWRAVQIVGRKFGCSHVALGLAGETHEQQLDPAANARWALQIPLSNSEYVQLTYGLDSPAEQMVLAPLAETLQRALTVKAAEFGRIRSGQQSAAQAAASSASGVLRA
jgi:UDP-GlcNAc:undecaprenyl-phosphate GlcNAc-1-phosphate transferase